MIYQLMNKDHIILRADLDQENNSFTSIIEVVDFQYAPLGLYLGKNDLQEELDYWYHHRYLPDYRLGFYELLENLDLFELYDYHETFYSFNLSDHYWIKPEDSELTYHDILQLKKNILPNFYEAGLFQKSHPLPTYADPNIATEGMLPKAWLNKDNKVVLVKGYLSTELEPYNEVFAYMIGKKLGIDVIQYQLFKVEDHVYSICENFIDEHSEIVVAEDIMLESTQEYTLSSYLKILEKHGIDGKKSLNDMFLLDYLICNSDRHMHNFGVIRDPDTLQWIKPCPLYDHGTSLLSNNSAPKYFKEEETTFEKIKSCITNHYDLSLLDEVFNEFKALCKAYPIDEATVDSLIDIVKKQRATLK